MAISSSKVLFVIALTIVFVLYSTSQTPNKIPNIQLKTVSGSNFSDPCLNKERCVAVYMASWCSACQSAIPLVKELRQYAYGSEQVGMKIILGRDQEENIEKLSEKFEEPVYFDENDQFYNAMKARGVPHWWVWDKKGNILKDIAGTYSGGSLDQLVNHVIDKQLELSDFM